MALGSLAKLKANPWYIWTILSMSSLAGIAAEKTRLGAALSSPLVTMFITLTLCNLKVLPAAHPIYSLVMKFLVPLAIPLLLFDADLRKCLKYSGNLMKAFICGTIGSIIGTMTAYALVPMRSIPGAEKIAAALCARHIGGAVNFVAVSDFLGTSPETVTAAIAADNVVVAAYFLLLFALTKPGLPDETSTTESVSTSTADSRDSGGGSSEIISASPLYSADTSISNSTSQSPSDLGIVNTSESSSERSLKKTKEKPDSAGQRPADMGLSLESLSSALTMAFCLYGTSVLVGSLTGASPIVLVSMLTVVVCTAFPRLMGSLTSAGGVIGVLFMQYFFAVTGAMGDISSVITMAPSLFLHTSVQISMHFTIIVTLGKLLKLPFREVVLASNANVGGPTTAAAMATSKRWKSLVLPALFTGVFGYAIGTGTGLAVERILRSQCYARTFAALR
jgi:uncharacterized membrane protein